MTAAKQLSKSIRLFQCTADNKKTITLGEILAKGDKNVIISLPGAFTPVCQNQHLPDYVKRAKELKDAGATNIIVAAVNDPFVLEAFGKTVEGAADNVTFVSDANAELAEALGQTKDLSAVGLGKRSTRYAAVVNKEGEVLALNVDSDLGYNQSKAENIVQKLKELKEQV